MADNTPIELSSFSRHRVRSFRSAQNVQPRTTPVFPRAATRVHELRLAQPSEQAIPLGIVPISKEATEVPVISLKTAMSLESLANQICNQAENTIAEPPESVTNDSWLKERAAYLDRLYKNEAATFGGSHNFAPQTPVRSNHPESTRSKVYVVKRRPRMARRIPRTGLRPYTTQMIGDGRRIELYESGAGVVKDAIGRVIEVRSQEGYQLFLTYSASGNLQSFCLLDACGNLHAVAEQDQHGAIVRGPNGRIQAAGEYMSAGPNGCLTVHRFDGQFWSIDIVLGRYTERRLIRDRNDQVHCLTAIFADDGFRMMTRFQSIPSGSSDGSNDDSEALESNIISLSGNTKAVLRFYGRDGSMLEFDSDENLEALQPKKFNPPSARHAAAGWHRDKQARTAWDAVEHYLGFDARHF
jgi:hypothetical protein